MRGIDVSSNNGCPFNAATEQAYRESDFVIVKSTQGTGYINPYMDYAVNRVKADNKLLGFYHYAGGGNAIAEARAFYETVKKYIGKALMCLDWEREQNSAFGSKTWCLAFITEFHKLSGIYPVIYTGPYVLDQVANCRKKSLLWLAGYPTDSYSWFVPNMPYNIAPWNTYFIWQFTSEHGTIDKNTCPYSKQQWLDACKPNSTVKLVNADVETELEGVKMAIDDIAKKVWAYKNTRLEKRDAYGILREIRDDVKAVRKTVEAINKKVK